MNTKRCTTLAFCAAFVPSLYAGSFLSLSSTNDIVLNFDSRIPEVVKDAISVDFQLCLIPSASKIKLYHFDREPTNRLSLASFWQPYSFAAIDRLGPNMPEDGVLSNGTFIIDVSYAFATNYQHHIESTASYSHEIAAAYMFIESLSPTNLNIMSTNELLSLDLWKEVPPGQHPIPEKDLARVIRSIRTTKYYSPPRFAFSVWECGPTNSPPYLWCFPPSLDRRNSASSEIMVFYQNRWWFTEWFLHPGEQQW